MLFTNERRTRNYGLRVGDVCRHRFKIMGVERSNVTVKSLSFDNNRVHVSDVGSDEVYDAVAEWLEIVERVEKSLIREAFAGPGKQRTEAQLLSIGLTQFDLDQAVADGDLRKGVSGYWLPAPPDPGAAAVMHAAVNSKSYNDYQGE